MTDKDRVCKELIATTEQGTDLLKYHLEYIAYSDKEDLDSNDMDVYGETVEGYDCAWSIEITEIAGQAHQRIADIESQLAKAKQTITEHEAQEIWGFYEDEFPVYTTRAKRHHGLSDIATVAEVNGLVSTLKDLVREKAELTERLGIVREQRDVEIADLITCNAKLAKVEKELAEIQEAIRIVDCRGG